MGEEHGRRHRNSLMAGEADSEAWRRACEAREWLRRTNRDPVRIRLVLARIAAKRGQAASDELREEMRKQWRQG